MSSASEPLDLESLRQRVRAGERFEYVFFWGPTPTSEGRVDKACLCQWYPATFVVDGRRYATAEHFMMDGKARLFCDDEAAARILAARSPAEAQRLGRLVRGFDETLWAARRFEIVAAGNVAKFSQNPALGEFLLGTGDHVLVEASPHDRIWGVGLAAERAYSEGPEGWMGLNLLGFALMKARAELSKRRR